jgi:ribosomal protein S12 methylthiotransferase
VGCFTYSPVFGADANELPNQVDEEVKLERLDRFMLLQQKISTEKLAKKVSTVQDVIIDEIRDEGLVGRTKGDAPEIDGVVYVNNESNKSIKVGDIVKVCITASDEYDLEGDVI